MWFIYHPYKPTFGLNGEDAVCSVDLWNGVWILGIVWSVVTNVYNYTTICGLVPKLFWFEDKNYFGLEMDTQPRPWCQLCCRETVKPWSHHIIIIILRYTEVRVAASRRVTGCDWWQLQARPSRHWLVIIITSPDTLLLLARDPLSTI